MTIQSHMLVGGGVGLFGSLVYTGYKLGKVNKAEREGKDSYYYRKNLVMNNLWSPVLGAYAGWGVYGSKELFKYCRNNPKVVKIGAVAIAATLAFANAAYKLGDKD